MPSFRDLSESQRSALMARIRKKDTKPEIVVRRLAHAMGFRFRLHRRDLPGTPDLVFPRLRKAVLVHGCFWHRHDCRLGRKTPDKNLDYWRPKLERNQARDTENELRLRALGWDVMVVWECQVGDLDRLRAELAGFLSGS